MSGHIRHPFLTVLSSICSHYSASIEVFRGSTYAKVLVKGDMPKPLSKMRRVLLKHRIFSELKPFHALWPFQHMLPLLFSFYTVFILSSTVQLLVFTI